MQRRVVARRVLMVLAGITLATLTLPLFVPAWQSALGRTFCYPFIGPVQRFNPDLSDSLLARVRAHENVYADQCRRDGALWHNLRRLVPSQRLQAESEAFCGEVRWGAALGGQTRLAYARALDELRESVWFHRFSDEQIAAALRSQCPDLAASARRQQAAWENRRRSGVP